MIVRNDCLFLSNPSLIYEGAILVSPHTVDDISLTVAKYDYQTYTVQILAELNSEKC